MDPNLRQADLMEKATSLARVKAGLLDFIIALVLCVVPVLGVAYWLTKDALFEKGSFGKRLWKIRIVEKANGQSIYKNWGLSFKRNLFTALPIINVLEWVLILSGKGLGDRWAKTEALILSERPDEATYK